MTIHKILYTNSKNLYQIADNSTHLIVTSPPYPMIEMWDETFSQQNPAIQSALNAEDGSTAFELMHQELDKVWDELYRVIVDGGIACINIGDATRTLNGNFQLFNNHSRIVNHCLRTGFQTLPAIIWRKQTNAPNKFMGSGMLAPGAYVTLEHEYILILRKGTKRPFKTEEEKAVRNQSAYFWEERNSWFSDVWMDLKGTGQKLNHRELRERSGAYPFELAYRLVNMFSVKGETVLDPFLGTGTTLLAAMASERNSIGVEIDRRFSDVITERVSQSKTTLNEYIQSRLERHSAFVETRESTKDKLKHHNSHHNFPVMTRQETNTKLDFIDSITQLSDDEITVTYTPHIEKEKLIRQMQLQL